MAPGFNVFSRVAHYIAQEVIVKGLANNRAFQQFALRSAEQISEVRNAVKDTAKKLSDTPTANQLKNESDLLKQRASGAVNSLREDIRNTWDEMSKSVSETVRETMQETMKSLEQQNQNQKKRP